MSDLKVSKLTDFKWLNMFKVEHDGIEWMYASRKNVTEENFNSLVDQPDAVVIVPFHNHKIVLIEEFRQPIQRVEVSFPAGLYEASDTIESAVTRELREETGLNLKFISKVTPPIYSSSGLTDESVVVVYAHCTGDLTLKNQENGERILNVLEIYPHDISSFLESSANEGKLFGAKAYLILQMLSMTGPL